MALRPNAGNGILIFWYLDHIQRRTTAGMTPLNEWSTRAADLYLQHTTLTTNKQTRQGRDSNAQSQQANLRLRSRGHWDRQLVPNTEYCSH